MAKYIWGKVISLKMQKTIIVEVENRRAHPLYKKMLKTNKHYKAHFEGEGLIIGQKVKIQETRPVSKEKTWKVVAKL